MLIRLDSLAVSGTPLTEDEIIDLINAVSDPAPEISRYADAILRKLSRNPDGYGDVFTMPRRRRLQVSRKWIGWFLEQEYDIEIAEDDLRLPKLLRTGPQTVGDHARLMEETLDWDQ